MKPLTGINALPGRSSVLKALIHRFQIFAFAKNLHSIPKISLKKVFS